MADDDADADAFGDGEFHVITAGADDVDSCGDAAVGCCGEVISNSIWVGHLHHFGHNYGNNHINLFNYFSLNPMMVLRRQYSTLSMQL